MVRDEQTRFQHDTDRAARVRVELAQANQLLQHAQEEAQGSSLSGALIQAIAHLIAAVDDLAAVVGLAPAPEIAASMEPPDDLVGPPS